MYVNIEYMEDLTQYIREVKDNHSASAYYKVVQLCEAKVFTMCYRTIGNREEAEEAAQDVFLKCFEKIHLLEDESRFLPWILKIAYNRSIDYIRRKKTIYLELDHEKVGTQSFIEDVEWTKSKSDLDPYLSICDESERAIITFYYQEEMSTQEIADTLKMTKSNVKIKLFRARNKIKQFIEGKDKNISK
ncbi:MAG: sigma-70 family RNA polymerase sigma factor [Saprospiraceae bacterium]|nr:sigma-70 family RNA polymerase sigma factor [Saprospiraceae bacterium]